MERDFDVVIIGSGFGGSVSALRLTEKNYRVCILEAGRRFIRGAFGNGGAFIYKGVAILRW